MSEFDRGSDATRTAANPDSVTAVVPARDAEATLAAALASTAKQTAPVAGVIVVDDGSSDGTAAIANASHATVQFTSGIGAASARNRAIEAADSQWIALLDADDEWVPEHIERALLCLEQTGADVFMAMAAHRRGDRVEERPMPWPEEAHWRSLDIATYADYYCVHSMLHTSTVVFRRSDAVDSGLFDGSLRRRHDLDLWLRLLRGRRWCFDRTPHAVYRVSRPGSLSENVPARNLATAEVLARHVGDIPALEPALRRYVEWSVRTAITSPDPADRIALARLDGHLTWRQRCLVRIATLAPGPLLSSLVAAARRDERKS